MKSTEFYREMYKERIYDELISRYNMKEQEVSDLLETHSLDSLIDENEDYFFYESPEYWADFLVSPLL